MINSWRVAANSMLGLINLMFAQSYSVWTSIFTTSKKSANLCIHLAINGQKVIFRE